MENFLTIDRLHTESRDEHRPSPWAATSRAPSGVDASGEGTGKFPTDLSVIPTRRLRALCNQTYQSLDHDYPPMEAREQYEALVEELEHREVLAETRTAPEAPRGAFRDNPLFGRFELFHDGMMAGYMRYEMRGGDVLLFQTVVDPQFHQTQVAPLLIQHVFLNAHRRRLALIPYCPATREFLLDYPQYLSLLPARQRHRFEAFRVAHDRYENTGR